MRENLDVTIEFPGHEPIHTTTDAIKRAADAAERRSDRARRRMAEGIADAAELSQEMADAGLISQQAADETAQIAAKAAKNTGLDPVERATGTLFAKDQLKSIIERVERLEEEKKSIADDIKDVFAEAKGNGFDVKALKTIVRLRKQDANERTAAETILDTYMLALGMI